MQIGEGAPGAEILMHFPRYRSVVGNQNQKCFVKFLLNIVFLILVNPYKFVQFEPNQLRCTTKFGVPGANLHLTCFKPSPGEQH